MKNMSLMKIENNKGNKDPSKVIFSHGLGWVFFQNRNASHEISKHDPSDLGRYLELTQDFAVSVMH